MKKLNSDKPSALWRLGSWLWLLVVILASVHLGVRAYSGIQIETDILELLPATQRNPLVDQASKEFIARFGQQVILFIAVDSDKDSLLQACNNLSQDALFKKVHCKISLPEGKQLIETLGKFNSGLYSDTYLEILNSPAAVELLKSRILKLLASPFPGLPIDLDKDPLLLLPDYLGSLPKPPGEILIDDGFVTAQIDGRSYVIIRAILNDNLFNRSYQQQVSQKLAKFINQLQAKYEKIDVLQAGALQFAEEMATRAEQDVKLVTFGSTIAIILVLLITFLSPVPLLLSLATIMSSFLVAFSISLYFFPKVHVITLGFGASLIGVCSDYSFHFFSHRLAKASLSTFQIIKQIRMALSLGAVTSVLGYLGLLLVPFPGLAQMALFAVCGIFSCLFSVFFFYPYLGFGLSSKPLSKFRQNYYSKLLHVVGKTWSFATYSLFFKLSMLSLFIFGATGLTQLNFNDDVRQLQSKSEKMQADEMKLQTMLGGIEQSRFFLVMAESSELVLQKESLLVKELTRSGIYVQALSSFLPAVKTQLNRFYRLQHFISDNSKDLQSELNKIGYDPTKVTNYFETILNEQYIPITLDRFINMSLAEPVRDLWLGKTDNLFASVVLLGKNDTQLDLQQYENPEAGVYFLDITKSASDILKHYRITASWYIAGCYLLVYLILLLRFGIRRGTLAIGPAVFGSICAIGLQSWMGISFNLFSVLAYTIVLGLAVDYTIFLLEENESATKLVIGLSALSTLASFGLLAFTSTPVLASFGIAMSLGVVLALLFCPLILRSAVLEK